MVRAAHPPALRDAAPAAANDRQIALPLATPPPEKHSAAAARRLWFCVYLPNLPLEASLPGREAAAVLAEQNGVRRVLLANAAARRAGVQPGQSANAALALLPTLQLAEQSELAEQQALESLASRLECFTSFVSIAGGDLLLLEIAASLKLFGGLKRLRRRIVGELERPGFAASVAIATTPLAATWLARSGRRACVRDAANLASALRPLPLNCSGWPPALLQSLKGMGITTIGDCLRLPREGLARRFGALRLLELDRALGRLPDPRPSWRAPERFSADFEMTEEQDDRELLLAICNELLEAHERFLLARQQGTRRIAFAFFHLRSPATLLSLGSAGAERSAERWLDLLRIRFERVSLPEPVIAVRLESGAAEARAGEPARLPFHAGARPDAGRRAGQLVERLAARIGEGAVHGMTIVADHRPQRAWMRTRASAARGAPAAVLRPGGKRPLWMLPEPAPLPVDGSRPLCDGRLELVDGPERLETGWWDGDGIARDYYTAVDCRGRRLWVFRNRRQPGWYLHGLFG